MKTQTLSEEEQQSLEKDGLSNIKKEPVVACPNWKLFCAERDIEEKLTDEKWLETFEDVFELRGEKEDQIEEFDGLNSDFSSFVLTAKMDLLMRGFSISIVTQEKKVNISVQGMYKLNLNLPLDFDVTSSRAFFNCKTRSLIIVLPIAGMKIVEESSEPVEEIKEEPKEE